MSYFPFFIEIGQKPCLVVGGGMVALRKIEKLLPFGGDITVVSPAFCREVEEMAGIRSLGVLAAAFQSKYEVTITTDWREPLCLYTVAVAAPAERKSAVLSASAGSQTISQARVCP